LKEGGGFCALSWYLRRPDGTARGARVALGRAGTVATIYFLAARLLLALLSKPSNVAVFWPASGIAVDM